MSGIYERDFPHLRQWMESKGGVHDGEAEDFLAHIEALEIWSRGVEAQVNATGATAQQRAMALMMRAISISVIETAKLPHCPDFDRFALMQCGARAAGWAIFNAAAALMTDETPWREMATVLIEEFRHGAKAAADLMAESAAVEAAVIEPMGGTRHD